MDYFRGPAFQLQHALDQGTSRPFGTANLERRGFPKTGPICPMRSLAGGRLSSRRNCRELSKVFPRGNTRIWPIKSYGGGRRHVCENHAASSVAVDSVKRPLRGLHSASDQIPRGVFLPNRRCDGVAGEYGKGKRQKTSWPVRLPDEKGPGRPGGGGGHRPAQTRFVLPTKKFVPGGHLAEDPAGGLDPSALPAAVQRLSHSAYQGFLRPSFATDVAAPQPLRLKRSRRLAAARNRY